MASAHQRSRQSSTRWPGGVLLVLAASLGGGCRTERVPSLWPPADFELVVEERERVGGSFVQARRFRVGADHVASFATASTALCDAATTTELPVYARLAVYQLEPSGARLLARKIARCGVADLDPVQGEQDGSDGVELELRWRAFEQEVALTARGRVHGAMAEILAIVDAHLPAGEHLRLAGVAERAVSTMVSGAPEPRLDAEAAFDVLHKLSLVRAADDGLVLEAFALACHLRHREDAHRLAARWERLQLERGLRRRQFPDELPRLTEAVLRRLVPTD